MSRAQPETFNIWAPKRQAQPGAPPPGTPGAPPQTASRLSCGQMTAGITWVPGDRPEIGQLSVWIQKIRFEPTRLDQPANKVNPFITIVAYDDAGQPKQIPRWDPRSGLRKTVNA